MWDQLAHGRGLPPTQLVRTKPREAKDGKLEPIARANVPPIEASLGPNTRIGLGIDGVLRIPD